jgi:hypothetical protein
MVDANHQAARHSHNLVVGDANRHEYACLADIGNVRPCRYSAS